MAAQRYTFVKAYRSGAGAWDVGQVVELEPEMAEWFNRDVPGCLEAVVETDPTKMSRDQLNAYAAGRGVVNPESLANKDEVLAAIEATAHPAEPEPEPEPEPEQRAPEAPERNRQVRAPAQKREGGA